MLPASERDPEGWSAADEFTVELESGGLNDTALSAFCLERGLYPVRVDRWRQAAQDANAQPQLTMNDHKALQKRHQEDQREIKQLQHRSCAGRRRP